MLAWCGEIVVDVHITAVYICWLGVMRLWSMCTLQQCTDVGLVW